MADLTITAANVLKGSNAVVPPPVVAGEAITQGQAVYQNTSDAKYYKAKANVTTNGNNILKGVALSSAAAGQPLLIQIQGQITIGSTVVVGTLYALSGAAAGGIAPVADLASGWYVNVVGVAISATIIDMNYTNGSVAVP